MWITKRVFRLRSIKAQSPNPKFSCNFRLVSSFVFHLLSSPLLFFSTATSIFPTQFFSQGPLELPSSSSQLFLRPNGGWCLFFCQLRSYIFNIILITIANPLFMRVCSDMYAFIELDVGALIFSQLASTTPVSSPRTSVHVFSIVLISQCTMGAFIVPLREIQPQSYP